MNKVLSLAVAPIPRREATVVEGPHYLVDWRVRGRAGTNDFSPFDGWTATRDEQAVETSDVHALLGHERPMWVDRDPPGVTKRAPGETAVIGDAPLRRVNLNWAARIWTIDRALLVPAGATGTTHPAWTQFAADPAVPGPAQVTMIERRRYPWDEAHWLDVVLLDVGSAIEFGAPLATGADPFASWSGRTTADAALLELDPNLDLAAAAAFFEEFGVPPEVIQAPLDRWSNDSRPWFPLTELVRRRTALLEAASQVRDEAASQVRDEAASQDRTQQPVLGRPLDPSWRPLLPGETRVVGGFGSLGIDGDGRPVLHVALWDTIALRYAEAVAAGRVRRCQAPAPRSRQARCGKVFIAPRSDAQAYCSSTCQGRAYQRQHYESIQARRGGRGRDAESEEQHAEH